MKALGLDGVSKSEVPRICAELDPLVEAFRTRPLTGKYPYVWVDATYHKVRVDGRVVSQATVVAVGVTQAGERQVLGVDVGPSEDRAFWTAFLRGLVKRGLRGVRLVISDAHEGLKQAIKHGANGRELAAVPRALHAQPAGDRAAGGPGNPSRRLSGRSSRSRTTPRRWRSCGRSPTGLRPHFPRAATLLEDAAEDVLAYRRFPPEHQRQLHSTDVLERLNKEIKCRSNVVGIFPTVKAAIRLIGAILLEQDDEWAVAERRYFSEQSMQHLADPDGRVSAHSCWPRRCEDEGLEDRGGRRRPRRRRGRAHGCAREFPPLDGTLPATTVCRAIGTR